VTTTTVDLDPSNDSSTATTAVTTSADVGVSGTDTPDPVAVGQDVTYELTVTNDGPRTRSPSCSPTCSRRA